LLQRQEAELASFALIARAETTLAEKIGRHVFEVADLSRVSLDRYNFRVWMVETEGTKLPTPLAVMSEPVSRDGAGNGNFGCRGNEAKQANSPQFSRR
jgi:hypothetical protein